jgi:DnaJ-domain-containing protein 1
MSRFLVPFVAALLGASAGTYAVLRFAPPTSPAAPAAGEAAADGDVKAELAAIRRWLERPGSVRAPGTLAASPTAATGAGAAPAGTADGSRPLTTADLEAAVAKAVEATLDERAEADKAAAAAEKAPKPRKTLAEVARELNLSSAQEDAVRQAYREAGDRLLKVMAEPESDAETLRRELEAAKGDQGKTMGLVTKYMPKFITKLGDVMSIQAERDEKIRKAVGDENVQRLDGYRIEEEDPFGLDGDVSVGVRAGGG